MKVEKLARFSLLSFLIWAAFQVGESKATLSLSTFFKKRAEARKVQLLEDSQVIAQQLTREYDPHETAFIGVGSSASPLFALMFAQKLPFLVVMPLSHFRFYGTYPTPKAHATYYSYFHKYLGPFVDLWEKGRLKQIVFVDLARTGTSFESLDSYLREYAQMNKIDSSLFHFFALTEQVPSYDELLKERELVFYSLRLDGRVVQNCMVDTKTFLGEKLIREAMGEWRAVKKFYINDLFPPVPNGALSELPENYFLIKMFEAKDIYNRAPNVFLAPFNELIQFFSQHIQESESTESTS